MNKVMINLALNKHSNSRESGVFVGVEASRGDFKAQRTIAQQGIVTEIASGERYGLLAGYKQFFNFHIGRRYYANVSFNDFSKQGIQSV
ncbi:hypothetical protein [Helicobacter sp. 23-1046]